MNWQSQLERLDQCRVLGIELRLGKVVHIYERCDEFFGEDMTTDEVRSLANELIKIADGVDQLG